MNELLQRCDAIPVGAWREAAAELRQTARNCAFDERSVRRWARRLRMTLDAGDAATAVHIIAVGLLLSPNAVLAEVRRHGLLRASRIGVQDECVPSVVRELMDALPTLSLADGAETYLASVATLHVLARQVHVLRTRLIRTLRERGNSVFDGLVRTIELLFLGVFPDGKKLVRGRTKEERAEALSELWMLAVSDGHDPHVGGLPEPDVQGVLAGTYLSMLDSALPLRKFREWERLVDLLDYRCLEERPGRLYRVRPPDATTEMALRFGFIQAEQQAAIRSLRVDVSGVMSWSDVVEQLDKLVSSQKGHGMIERVAQPYSRLRVHLPDYPPILSVLSDRGLMAEEVRLLTVLAEEYMTSPEELQALHVSPDVEMWHVLVLQRVVNIMRVALQPHLEREWNVSPGLVVRTLLPTLATHQLESLLTPMMGETAARSVIALLTKQKNEDFFDIQYQPILKWNSLVSLPTSVLGLSSIVRNVMQHTKVRVKHGTIDPGDVILASVLQRSGGLASANVVYKLDGKRWETDVVGRIGSALIAIEAKRTLLPSNAKELQTTVDAARDAANQLDRFLRHFARDDGRIAIQQSLGWSTEGVQDLLTCIVLSNRMFSGMRFDGHPVRGLHELGSFIATGSVPITELGSNGEERTEAVARYWRGGQLEAEDMVGYLRDNLVHRDLFASMRRTDATVTLGRVSVVEENYELRQDLIFERLRARVQPSTD